MSSVLSNPRFGRLPVIAAADRNITLAINGAIRVISDRYATETDRQLVLHDLEIASKQHIEAKAKRQKERRHG
jgi:hypothetical protein